MSENTQPFNETLVYEYKEGYYLYIDLGLAYRFLSGQNIKNIENVDDIIKEIEESGAQLIDFVKPFNQNIFDPRDIYVYELMSNGTIIIDMVILKNKLITEGIVEVNGINLVYKNRVVSKNQEFIDIAKKHKIQLVECLP